MKTVTKKIKNYLFLCILTCSCVIYSCKKSTPKKLPPLPPPIPENPSPRSFFEVKDSKILDTNGVEFIGKGVNVNGPKWPWERPTIPDAGLIADTWKCNIVRVNCWYEFTATPNNNLDLDGIIKEYTNRKVVVMLEDHNFTGRFPEPAELTKAIAWWKLIAQKYKNNTYVWFNLMNEPGGSSPVTKQWLDVNDTMIAAIRETGANNIIVCDENHFGQANGYDKDESSGALTYGPTLVSKYKNILFSLHLYDFWIYGEARLKKYVTQMKAKKLALIIGEYGVADDYSMKVSSNIFKVVIPEKIGRIAWHWVGVDIHRLTNSNGFGGWSIDNKSGSKPGNLSFAGNLVWLDNHNQLTATDAALETVPVIFTNPNFEYGEPKPGDFSIPGGWINYGTASLDNTPANVKSGSYAIRIKEGEQGGCGVLIYLKPGQTYRLSAWGKHSVMANSATVLELKYATNLQESDKNLTTLEFKSDTYQQQSITFTVPNGIEKMFVSIYKTDGTPAFWCDDIAIVKQ